MSRLTRQVVADEIGDRSEASCRKLWEKIPEAYRSGHCYTDFWQAYQQVIPDEQHTAVGKEWSNGARRALEQYVEATAGALCAKEFIIFKIRGDARDLFALVSSSL